jgi:hypothetical protein
MFALMIIYVGVFVERWNSRIGSAPVVIFNQLETICGLFNYT